MKIIKSLLLTAIAAAAGSASAQSSVALYGTIDQYFNYMRSSSGASYTGMEDGAFLRSRMGFRGTEDLGGGLTVKFVLERGFNALNGSPADASRGFDRQSWVGLGTSWGDFRIGRQNGVVFGRGDYIDYTSRTLGSMINNFGVPSRYDNDIAYISPRWNGLLFELHYALAETTNGISRQRVAQYGLDYLNGPFRIGYAGMHGSAPPNALYPAAVKYDNVYANYDYGKGKVYLAYVRSNNSTATAISNNAGTILGNVGGVVAGTNPDVNRNYNIWQISADYRIASNLRVGALWGRISDTSDTGHDATGGSVAAYYDLSKRTMIYGIVQTLRNGPNAGFRFGGSAALPTNFTNPRDINGQTLRGAHVGVLHRF